jgi:tripartite-type tricarboxylate transporter receptor subunit TctC
VQKALTSPDLLKRFAEQGAEPGGMPSAEFQKFVREETQRWGTLIRQAGVKPE